MSKIVTFARQELGLELYPKQAEAVALFEEGGYQLLTLRWGRRAGKSTVAEIISLYDAIVRDHLREHLRDGELRISGLICPREQQARDHLINIRSFVDRSAKLRKMLIASTENEISFSNGSTIRVYPASARGIRGGSWSSAVLDEMAWFIDSEGNASGSAVWSAVQPSLATFGQSAWTCCISTPKWRAGNQFATLCDRAEGKRYPYMLGLHASTVEVNPRIDPEWLRQRELEDIQDFRREYLAEWVDGVGSFLNSIDVFACRRATDTLAPRADLDYQMAIDPGFERDAFAAVIAHLENETVVVDCVATWTREGFENTLQQVAELARKYAVRYVISDQFAPSPVREGLEKFGLTVDVRDWTNKTKQDAFTQLKAALNSRTISLPNDDDLAAELCGLESTKTAGGFTRIAAAGSGHDDRATALAAIVNELAGDGGGGIAVIGGDFGYDRRGYYSIDPETGQRVHQDHDPYIETDDFDEGFDPNQWTRIA